MSIHIPSTFKAAATVREVCRLVQLSTARFYELQQIGVFPLPVYDVRSRRPFFTEEHQRLCVQIRVTGLGLNDQPVIFYQQRRNTGQPMRSRNTKAKSIDVPASDSLYDVLAAVKSLGLTATTAADVQGAVEHLFPGGAANVDQGQIIRQVFVFLNRHRSGS